MERTLEGFHSITCSIIYHRLPPSPIIHHCDSVYTMAYTQLYYHLVFRTKNSEKTINEAHETDLYKYAWGFCKAQKAYLKRINGMPDHIHMLVAIPPTIAVASFVHDLKLSLTSFCKRNPDLFPQFRGWGDGYCSLSYGINEIDKIYNYIKNQKEHHRKKSFREELIEVLTECGIAYDERYI